MLAESFGLAVTSVRFAGVDKKSAIEDHRKRGGELRGRGSRGIKR